MTYIWMTYCCLVHIYKWPIIVLYMFPNSYRVDMTFLYVLLCAMIHILLKSYYSSHIVQVTLFKPCYSSQLTQVIPSQYELVREVKLFYHSRGSNENRDFERAVHHLMQLIWVCNIGFCTLFVPPFRYNYLYESPMWR